MMDYITDGQKNISQIRKGKSIFEHETLRNYITDGKSIPILKD